MKCVCVWDGCGCVLQKLGHTLRCMRIETQLSAARSPIPVVSCSHATKHMHTYIGAPRPLAAGQGGHDPTLHGSRRPWGRQAPQRGRRERQRRGVKCVSTAVQCERTATAKPWRWQRKMMGSAAVHQSMLLSRNVTSVSKFVWVWERKCVALGVGSGSGIGELGCGHK